MLRSASSCCCAVSAAETLVEWRCTGLQGVSDTDLHFDSGMPFIYIFISPIPWSVGSVGSVESVGSVGSNHSNNVHALMMMQLI